ncbi:hypothetical protein C4901_02140 [Acidiferrobacter sp. SPIII_3]|uniref:transposase n=1 Tax=Acidiferrobacter sp. SPIII_3 TaxID=1281578 RepID=UPI000D72B6F4|nr:transposase [Acidiferrobacter sp. SPIII_3]AWP22303.1 hypothetical protein C4901_02140 [Acidiferrobacter sp. SPIII_3]
MPSTAVGGSVCVSRGGFIRVSVKDLVRRREHRELQAQGEETLTKTRYLWLKNPLNWTDRQRERFQTLKVDALKVGRAWAIKEAFSDFWDYRYTGSANKFFDRWYFWATVTALAFPDLPEPYVP